MSDFPLIQPNVGLASIARIEPNKTTLPSQGQARMTGGRVHESVRRLYEPFTVNHLAIELTVPSVPDPELLHPNRFEAALLDAVDKMEKLPESERALGVLHEIRAARDQFRINHVALNQV
ncbi:MAG: hypothetical protein MI806_21935 [Minwuiales bacterium]|nr:hypothetical protein [Minwuiales bacterium]